MRVFAKTASLVVIFCVAHLLGQTPLATASIITVNFSGTVDFVDSALSPPFSIGNTLSGTYAFESTIAPNAGSNSTFAVFDALTSLNFSIDSYSASSAAAAEIQVDNNPPFPDDDRYTVLSRASQGLTGLAVNGLSLDSFSFRMDDSTNTVFSNALILPTNPSLAQFDSSRFFVFFTDGSDNFIVSGTLDSLSVQDVAATPEPASLAIWGGIGIAGLVAGWRRKRAMAKATAA